MILRLMKEQEDGSYKVVGYQKFEGGLIYHTKRLETILDNKYTDSSSWLNALGKHKYCGEIYSNYIPHDRIDRYTGVDIDGQKVFERDKVESVYDINYIDEYNDEEVLGTVTVSGEVILLRHEGWRLKKVTRTFEDGIDGKITISNPRYCRIYPQKGKLKITGIEGVNDER